MSIHRWMGKEDVVHIWKRKWQPTPVLWPGKSHGQRSLLGYSTWGCKESETTKRPHFTHFTHFILSLEKEWATHSSVLAWKTPWTEEPGRPWSMRLQRVGHDWSDSAQVPIYNGILLLGHNKGWEMPFALICMDLEIIILSEVSQKEKEKYHTISLTRKI